ncbi:MAG: DMT family transporter [Pseudomonadota bacterium]
MKNISVHLGIIYALLSAIFFGASTPFSKILLTYISPIMLAAFIPLGSGIGLLIWLIFQRLLKKKASTLSLSLHLYHLPWLIGAIASGGVLNGILLTIGLTLTPASAAALLLNMESVLTPLLAWLIFKERFSLRIFLAMMLTVIAGVLVSWEQWPEFGIPWGTFAILAACLCAAIDSNLMCKISGCDVIKIAIIKGLASGLINLLIALAIGNNLPRFQHAFAASALGFCGYGLSFMMFIMALRHQGVARTGAYFSVAPFVSTLISFVLLNDTLSSLFGIAAIVMAAGIGLMLTEKSSYQKSYSS